jgi:hypothetical protein
LTLRETDPAETSAWAIAAAAATRIAAANAMFIARSARGGTIARCKLARPGVEQRRDLH